MNKGYVQDWLPDESDGSFPTQPTPKRTAPNNPRIRIAAHKCHVIVVYSLSGGTGKTTIATNVAAALQGEGERVLLMDCALQSGDVGVFLNLQSQYSVRDLVLSADNLHDELVDKALVNHASGLKVLLAPRTPQDSEGIRADTVVQIIGKLRPRFDFIVVDTASQLDDLCIGLFDTADHLLQIVNPTLPSVKNTRTVLNLIDGLHYSANKSQLVINRANASLEKARVSISVAAIENNLKRKAFGVIPMDERRVQAAINRGNAIIDKEKNNSPAKELIELANALINLCKGIGHAS